METRAEAELFRALGDPTRLKLFRLLCSQRQPNAVCVGALAGLLGVTQSAVSQHLRVLKAVGLVRGERRGYHVHYFVELEALERTRQLVLATLAGTECAVGANTSVKGGSPCCQDREMANPP